MDDKKFFEIFAPMAMIHFRSLEGVRSTAKGYFKELQNFAESVLYETMLDIERDYDDKHFPGPGELKERCKAKVIEKEIRADEARHKITDEEVWSERNKAARRKFLEKVAEIHDKGLDKYGSNKPLHISVCLGQALIVEPYEREKKAQAREVEK